MDRLNSLGRSGALKWLRTGSSVADASWRRRLLGSVHVLVAESLHQVEKLGAEHRIPEVHNLSKERVRSVGAWQEVGEHAIPESRIIRAQEIRALVCGTVERAWRYALGQPT